MWPIIIAIILLIAIIVLFQFLEFFIEEQYVVFLLIIGFVVVYIGAAIAIAKLLPKM